MNNSLDKRGPLKRAAIIVVLAGSLLAPGFTKGEDKEGPDGAVLTGMRMLFARKLSDKMFFDCSPRQLGECFDRANKYALDEWDAEAFYRQEAEEHNWCWMGEEDFNDLMRRRQIIWGIRGWPREKVLGSEKYCSRRFEEDLHHAIGERAEELMPTDIRVEITREPTYWDQR